jgi:hypothetical protein
MLYSRQWSLLWQSSLCPRYSWCIAFSFYTSGYSRFSRETLIHLKKAHCVKEGIHVRFTKVLKAVIPKGFHVIKYGLKRKSVFQVQYSEHATIPKIVASCCFDLLHHYDIFQCVFDFVTVTSHFASRASIFVRIWAKVVGETQAALYSYQAKQTITFWRDLQSIEPISENQNVSNLCV